MTDLKKQMAINKAIIQVLESLLASGDWNASLFLKVVSRQFKKLRDEAQSLLEEAEALEEKKKTKSGQSISQKPPLKVNQVEVFILLYQAYADRLSKWEEILSSLTTNSVGRPIYYKESQAFKVIKSRGNLPQEGYACVYVDKNDIIQLPESRRQHDRFEYELLSLESRAVQTDNIHVFVHANAKRYIFKKGQLILEGPVLEGASKPDH